MISEKASSLFQMKGFPEVGCTTAPQPRPPHAVAIAYSSVSQPPGRDPVPDPGINYIGPREVLLEFVILVF